MKEKTTIREVVILITLAVGYVVTIILAISGTLILNTIK